MEAIKILALKKKTNRNTSFFSQNDHPEVRGCENILIAGGTGVFQESTLGLKTPERHGSCGFSGLLYQDPRFLHQGKLDLQLSRFPAKYKADGEFTGTDHWGILLQMVLKW